MNTDTGRIYENEAAALAEAKPHEHVARVPRHLRGAAMAAMIAGLSAYDPDASKHRGAQALSVWGRRKLAQAKKRERKARKQGQRNARRGK